MRATMMLGFATLALGGCGQPRALAVDHAWVRLPAVPGNPAAAYFTVHGGAGTVELTGIATDAAARAEMHQTIVADLDTHAMAMERVESVTVPAHADIAFAPGGRHVMLFGLKPGVRAGSTVRLTLDFSGTRMTQEARVIAAGDAAPL